MERPSILDTRLLIITTGGCCSVKRGEGYVYQRAMLCRRYWSLLTASSPQARNSITCGTSATLPIGRPQFRGYARWSYLVA